MSDDKPVLPDPRITPTITIPEAGRLLGLGRAASYQAANRGEIPVLSVGRKKPVPTAVLLRLLGIDVAATYGVTTLGTSEIETLS